MKAIFDNATQEDKIYPDFKPFSPNWLHTYITVCLVEGLTPSPNTNMKFQLQQDNAVNKNDFIYRSLRSNATNRH